MVNNIFKEKRIKKIFFEFMLDVLRFKQDSRALYKDTVNAFNIHPI